MKTSRPPNQKDTGQKVDNPEDTGNGKKWNGP